MPVLNNITTGNEYTSASELTCEGSNNQTIIILNAAVYLQYALRTIGLTGRSPSWEEEQFLPPGYYTWTRKMERIKFKSAAKGQPAQVTVNAI